jgi:hypothetical protein
MDIDKKDAEFLKEMLKLELKRFKKEESEIRRPLLGLINAEEGYEVYLEGLIKRLG